MEAKSKRYQQEESVRQYFDQIADHYPNRYSSAHPFHQYFFELRLALATDGLDFTNKNILDIGAGTGALYDFLQKKASGFSYHACDLSEEMLRQSSISPERYHVGTIETLNLRSIQFDYIFLLGLTSYLTKDQLLQHLNFIQKHLSPQGTAIISFTNYKALDFRFRQIIKPFLPKKLFKTKILNQNFEINAYSPKQISQLFSPFLQVNQIDYFNFSSTLLNTFAPKLSVVLAKWLQDTKKIFLHKKLANDFLIRLKLPTQLPNQKAVDQPPSPDSTAKPQNLKSKTAKFHPSSPSSPLTLHPSPPLTAKPQNAKSKTAKFNPFSSSSPPSPFTPHPSPNSPSPHFNILHSTFSLLMFSYYFPPIKSIGTLRNYNIYQEFVKYFQGVEVISTTNRHRLQQEHFENTPSVHEVKTLDYRWWLSRKKDRHVHLAERKKDKNWIQLLQRLLDSFPFNILVGDGGLFYIISAYRKAKQLVRKKNIQYLYSSFRPYSDHIAPYLLKTKYPNLFWIADFRDLHVDVNVKNTFAERFQHWCNRRILAKADVITTVSEGLAQHLRRYHSSVYVLRNGIGLATQLTTKVENYPKFTIAYTGSMFRKKRNPEALLQALAELIQEGLIDSEKIQIRYAGKDGALWQSWISKYGLKPIFKDLGMLQLQQANELQQSAHINLLLTFSSPKMNGNLTGKLYEYLNAKRPILTIVNGSSEPELEAILGDLQIGKVIYQDQAEAKNQILAFVLQHYQDWLKNGKLSFTIDENKLKNYHWESMMGKFLEFLNPRLSKSH